MTKIIESYDAHRAEHLHEELPNFLRQRAQKGEIVLEMVGSRFFVAPTLLNTSDRETFGLELYPPVQPDYEMYSALVYDNVPGLVIIQGRVVQDPYPAAARGNIDEFDKLTRKTKKRAEDLIRRTYLQLFPDISSLRSGIYEQSRPSTSEGFIMSRYRRPIPGAVRRGR